MTGYVSRVRSLLAGITDLCPEHLRQSIRHVQRNCDIDCNVHDAVETWDECKQPDRAAGERMALALASIPHLLARLDAVEALHVMEYIEDGEYSRNRCAECLYEAEDREECPTIQALTGEGE